MLVSIDGRRTYYDLAGPDDAPVVAMGHSLASDSGMWGEQMAPLLGAGFRVLRIDSRGHGGSDGPKSDYTMDQLADDIAAVIRALGIDRVHYVGLSIGGMFGQGFAIRHGELVRSLMLCDTLAGTPPAAKEAWGQRIEAVSKANSVAAVADATMERWFTDAFKAKNPARWNQIHATICATTPVGFLGCAAAIRDFDYAAKIGAIRAPTLVVCGSNDPGTPPAANRQIAQTIPGAQYEEIANARHFPNVERADVFNKIMMGWLQSRR